MQDSLRLKDQPACERPRERLAAQGAGASYILLGPIFPTPSKLAYGAPLGISTLREVTSRVSIPVFALGGIGLHNCAQVVSRGVRGIALISAVLSAPEPRRAAKELLALLPQVQGD